MLSIYITAQNKTQKQTTNKATTTKHKNKNKNKKTPKNPKQTGEKEGNIFDPTNFK
jgi:hypothetical protein